MFITNDRNGRMKANMKNRRLIGILSIVGGAVGLLGCAAIAVAVALSAPMVVTT
ncbi:MAG: hypothetical protein HW418_566 [Anaerolineales bacterium]|nr:hypothetical protein [Anaerolineales bacterium]